MDIIKLIAGLFLAVALYSFGYKHGTESTELAHAIDKVQAVTATLEKERQRQNELSAANRLLSADVDRVNRLLKSQAVRPADFESCIVERDRLRSVVKEAAELVVECRRGLSFCAAGEVE